MPVIKIDDVYLYTGLSKTGGNDCATAYHILKDNNIEFIHLNYSDPDQHDDVIKAINTWEGAQAITDFPFVHYDEIDDQFKRTRRFIVGLEDLKASNIANLYKLGR